MIYRCILPTWAQEKFPASRRVCEGQFTDAEITELNTQFYNIYFLPNHPKTYTPGKPIEGKDVDAFNYVFIDMDLKDKTYASKDEFIQTLCEFSLQPSRIVDSGNGVHAYWKVKDLEAMSFLRLQRRLLKYFKTDEAVGQIYQLMRHPGTVNTKVEQDMKMCELRFEDQSAYTCEQLDKALPAITHDDEEYCKQHYDRTYNFDQYQSNIDIKLPTKFGKLLKDDPEVQEIWKGNVGDRSAGDFRLGHIMQKAGFTKNEGLSVLVNANKALERAPKHRVSYAENIVNKIWEYEAAPDKSKLKLSKSVKELLEQASQQIKETRFKCWDYLDNTQHGFRLGQIIGLVAGSGVGKTAMALNMFMGFVERNGSYDHFFIPLEQPAQEIAQRWQKMCGEKTFLHDRVQVLSNYNDDGSYRHLSLSDIKDYIMQYQKDTGRHVGCVVIDHIGVLRNKGKHGENQDLMDICKQMKAFATETNTMLIMQSQAPREKAGIGDIPLDKDAAYGTVFFESFCDYLMTIWQPLKRMYSNKECPTVTAFKFCKIRHKNVRSDAIQEDVRYLISFDPETDQFSELSSREEKAFSFFNGQATQLRRQDRKTEVLSYVSTKGRTLDGKASDSEED